MVLPYQGYLYIYHMALELTVQRLEVTFARRDQLPGTRIESIQYVLQVRRSMESLALIFTYDIVAYHTMWLIKCNLRTSMHQHFNFIRHKHFPPSKLVMVSPVCRGQ